MEMDGKVVVVTGASMGIGEAIAKVFADAGANVVLLSRDAGRAEAARQRVGNTGRTAATCDSILRRVPGPSGSNSHGKYPRRERICSASLRAGTIRRMSVAASGLPTASTLYFNRKIRSGLSRKRAVLCTLNRSPLH